MTSRIFTSGFITLVFVSLLVFSIEFFIPLSAKTNMDTYCRGALISMEEEGGLTKEKEEKLKKKLQNAGFENIKIVAASNVKQGEELQLIVEADYKYNKLTSLLTRKQITDSMCYNRTAISRKVVN
jgi:hypothetical protein